MPSYRYSAIDHTGRPYNGTLEAENLEAVRTKLAELRYHIVNIADVGNVSGVGDFFKNFSRVKQKELVVRSIVFSQIPNGLTLSGQHMMRLRCVW